MQRDRIDRIRDYIDARGEASVAELLELCDGCSNMTLWRDLNRLEQEGSIRRTRGGAVAMRLIQPDLEGIYSQRAILQVTQKQAVARAALTRIHSGSALYLDAGSTLMWVAKLLGDEHYTVVTSAVNIGMELVKRRNCDVICLGGQLSLSTLSCSGPQAEAHLDNLNIDTAIMAASGFSLNSGFSCGNANESRLKRKVMEKAAHTLLIMDSSKLGHNLTYTFASLKDVDVFICDAAPSEDMREAASACGTELVEAR